MHGQGLDDDYGRLFDQCVIIGEPSFDDGYSNPDGLRGLEAPVNFGSQAFEVHQSPPQSNLGHKRASAGHLDPTPPWQQQHQDQQTFTTEDPSPASKAAADLSSSAPQNCRSNPGRVGGAKAGISKKSSGLRNQESATQIKPKALPASAGSASSPKYTQASFSKHSTLYPATINAANKVHRSRSRSPHAGKKVAQQLSARMMHQLQLVGGSHPNQLRQWASNEDYGNVQHKYSTNDQSMGLPISPPMTQLLSGNDGFSDQSAVHDPSYGNIYGQHFAEQQGFMDPTQSHLTPLPSPNAASDSMQRPSARRTVSSTQQSTMRDSSGPAVQAYPGMSVHQHNTHNDDDTFNFDMIASTSEFGNNNPARNWWQLGSHNMSMSQPDLRQAYRNSGVQSAATKGFLDVNKMMPTTNEYSFCDDGSVTSSLATQGLMISCPPDDMAAFGHHIGMDSQPHPYDYFSSSYSPSDDFYTSSNTPTVSTNRSSEDTAYQTPAISPSEKRLSGAQARRRPSGAGSSSARSRPTSFVGSPSQSPRMRVSKARPVSRTAKSSPNVPVTTAAAAASRNNNNNTTKGNHPRTPSTSSTSSTCSNTQPLTPSSPLGFVNFTPMDSKKILTGVAPSGSSKTKAKREKEARERSRRISIAAMKAVQAAGGNLDIFTSENGQGQLMM